MSDDDDPFKDPAWEAFAEQVREELVPKVKDSALSVALYTGGDPDPKQAIEIGYMVLLNKPIIVAVTPGAVVPENLMRVADDVVEVNMDDTAGTAQRLKEATLRVAEKRGLT